MKPKFEQAAYEMGIFDSLVFAEVDVEKHKDLGAKYKVGRVPTIKMFFKDNSKPPLDYLGEMETEKIIEYATLVVQMQDMKENAESKKQQVQENLVAEPIKEAPKVVTQKGSPSISIPDGVVVDLTPENFDKIVDGSRHVLVKFYAPWCGILF